MGKNFRRFMVKNRDKGIPNLMLYICIANAVLYLYTLFTGNATVVNALVFDTRRILQGQVWRCVTWLLTYGAISFGGGMMGLIYIFFYVLFNNWLGRVLETVWGTLRLNLYYFGGAFMTVIVALVIGLAGKVSVSVSGYYLNLSLMLAVATMIPEERVILFGIFPLKMRWLALFDIALIVLELISGVARYRSTPVWVVLAVLGTEPVVSILNYVLNFGKDVKNLLPIQKVYKQKKRQFAREAEQLSVSNTI